MSGQAMICTVDGRASAAGREALRAGGSAADAVVAANAVLAVVTPQQCGLGGDLFAIVHSPGRTPVVLNASGRTGSGADPAALRTEGHRWMPERHDIRSVTVPGCVDGWLALHERFGRLPLADLLEPAAAHAERGFAATAELVAAGTELDDWPRREGETVIRPGTARALRAVAAEGRSGFYQGEFGAGLLSLGDGLFTEADLAESDASWEPPLGLAVHGHTVWTAAPTSQGYLLLLALALSERLGLPRDPDDPAWAHLLAESAIAASADRVDRLHEGADGRALLAPDRVEALLVTIDPARHRPRLGPAASGDTICVCAVDADGMGVSLLQSNMTGLGSLLFEPGTGINLHSRGSALSLVAGSPAEYGPRRRPPHTLVPVAITRPDGSLRAVLGSMGGDLQPHVCLQLVTRLLRHGQSARETVGAARWKLGTDLGAFATWHGRAQIHLGLEESAPASWAEDLAGRGHRVRVLPDGHGGFGEAQLIAVGAQGDLDGAAEPRADHAAARTL